MTPTDRSTTTTRPGGDDRYALSLNGKSLRARKRGGRWTFTCAAWPDLAAMFDGAETVKDAADEFMRRALAPAVRVKKLAKGK